MSRCSRHRAKYARRCSAGGGVALLGLASAMVGLAALAGCSPSAWMCTRGGDCATTSSCVAGRCVAHGAVPAISTARRMLYDPVAVGYVRRGGGESTLPAMVALGRGDGALALLRFSLSLPPEAGVVEAYLLLDRVTDVDSDPEPIALHAAPVLDPWDARSLSWAVQPRVEEMGAPVTRVFPASGAIVRLDVRAIVERWRRRGGMDFGLAVVSDAAGRAAPAAGPDASAAMSGARQERQGMAFALAAVAGRGRGEGARDEGPLAPRLELYLR